jgi:hypothetical protein
VGFTRRHAMFVPSCFSLDSFSDEVSGAIAHHGYVADCARGLPAS